MQFDTGEVLPGLNENWTFGGATVAEWICGFMMFLIVSLFGETPARSMPFMIAGWLVTTMSLAAVRKNFPDEERGVRNALLTSCGLVPPDLPAPSKLQPIWSGAPVHSLSGETPFVKLGLEKLFPSFEDNYRDAETR